MEEEWEEWEEEWEEVEVDFEKVRTQAVKWCCTYNVTASSD